MPRSHVLLRMFLVGVVVLSGGLASGQNYPSKPLRVVTAAAGSASDFAARLIAQGLPEGLGQPVVVDNRPGVLPGDTVAKAPPDGYTLLVAGSILWIGPLLLATVPYDPVKDFAPITLATRAPNVLLVHPSLPVKSVRELIALAKAKPGALNYSTTGAGSPNHLASELFRAMTGVNITRVNYKSAAQQLNDLIAGQVQMAFASPAGATPHVKSGRLRALAVTSAQPSALFPGVPTVAAAAPGYEVIGITAVFAPSGTPAALINRLNQETLRVLNRPDVKEKFFNVAMETVGSSPEQLASALKSEIARMAKVIQDAGIRYD